MSADQTIISKANQLDTLSRKYGIWIILGLTLILLLPGTGTIPLIDRDEPRFTEATRIMTETGEWFVPYFNGDYRFDKPILTYWVMTPGLLLAETFDFIPVEWGARIHSVISAFLLGLTVFLIGRKWFSPAAGLLAGAGIISCLQVVMHGRSAVADMPMVVCVTLIQFAIYELLHPADDTQPMRRWFWMLYIALGVGFLAKGPVTWLIPILTLLIYRFALGRKALPWKNLRFFRGIIITLIIVGAWGIPALIKTNGLFWNKGMGDHVLERGFSTMAGFSHFGFYYLLTAFISLFPWAAYLGYGFSHLRKNWSSKNAFLVSWVLSTYVFFSLYFTQLPHYVMPAFAAIFLILGQLANTHTQPRKWNNILYRIALGLPFTISCIVLAFALLYPFTTTYAPLKPLFISAAGSLIGMCLLGIAPRRGKPVFALIGVLIAAAGLFVFGQALRNASITVKMDKALAGLPDNTTYHSVGFNEPGVVFYSHKQWQRQGEFSEELPQRIKQPGPRVFLFLEHEKPLEHFFQHIARTRLNKPDVELKEKNFSSEIDNLPLDEYEVLTIEGANPARTSWAVVKLFIKKT